MRSSIWGYVLYLVIGIGLLFLAGLPRGCRAVREMAVCVELENGLARSLNGYYREKGGYPESLDGLRFEPVGKRAEEIFAEVEYESTGVTCKFSYERESQQRGRYVLIECELGDGKSDYSRKKKGAGKKI